MLFWCIINVAVDYICTPSVLITATKILFWTLNYFIFFSEREKNFSQVIYLSFLGKSGNFTISKHYLTRFCWKNNYQRQRINVLFFFMDFVLQSFPSGYLKGKELLNSLIAISWHPASFSLISHCYLRKSKIYHASGAVGQIFIMIITKWKGNLKSTYFKYRKIAFAELNNIC